MQRLLTVYFDEDDEDYKVINDHYLDSLDIDKSSTDTYLQAEHSIRVLSSIEAWTADMMQKSKGNSRSKF